jgi:hypothetical protein
MEDLILGDDDGVEPNRDRDGVSRRRHAHQDLSARRQQRPEAAETGVAPCIEFDAVARLEQQAA